MRAFATRILSGDSLEEKLLTPSELTDNHPGAPLFWKEPTRPLGMQFTRRKRGEKLPSFHEHDCEEKRAICLHRFAGHELLAVEIMAYALLAFPDAPSSFRKGVIHTLKEEQGHVKLYMKRMSAMGLSLGDLPLYKHFWAHTPYLQSPIQYVSVMNLTLEMANLDFAPQYGASFARHGDRESAALMGQILHDEIRHVNFGWRWLKQFKDPSLSDWAAWTGALSPLLTPNRAQGFEFQADHRKAAGVSEEWLKAFKAYSNPDISKKR